MSTGSEFDNLHTEMFELGIQNRREVVGDVYVNAALQNGSSEFAYPGQQLVTEYVYQLAEVANFVLLMKY